LFSKSVFIFQLTPALAGAIKDNSNWL